MILKIIDSRSKSRKYDDDDDYYYKDKYSRSSLLLFQNSSKLKNKTFVFKY